MFDLVYFVSSKETVEISWRHRLCGPNLLFFPTDPPDRKFYLNSMGKLKKKWANRLYDVLCIYSVNKAVWNKELIDPSTSFLLFFFILKSQVFFVIFFSSFSFDNDRREKTKETIIFLRPKNKKFPHEQSRNMSPTLTYTQQKKIIFFLNSAWKIIGISSHTKLMIA